jgi:hypothetical protein
MVLELIRNMKIIAGWAQRMSAYVCPYLKLLKMT